MAKKLPLWGVMLAVMALAAVIAYVLYYFVIIPVADSFKLDQKYKLSMAFIAFLLALLLISQTFKSKKQPTTVSVQQKEDPEASKIKKIIGEI
jgi:hypothetical protein